MCNEGLSAVLNLGLQLRLETQASLNPLSQSLVPDC